MKLGMNVTAHIDTKRPEKIQKALEKTLKWGAAELKKGIQQKRRKIGQATKIENISKGKAIIIGAGLTENYAAYLEFGTGYWSPFGPHKIYPKTAKVLHWVDKSGKDVFAKWTRGMMAQPFVRPTLQAKRKPIADYFAGQVRRQLK